MHRTQQQGIEVRALVRINMGCRGATRGFASGGEPAELELLMLVFRECPKKVSACPPAGLLMLG
jgi:hypothetical protein